MLLESTEEGRERVKTNKREGGDRIRERGLLRLRVEYHLAIQRRRNPLCSVDIYTFVSFSRARKKHAMFQSGNGAGLHFSYLSGAWSVGSVGGKKGKTDISRRHIRLSPSYQFVICLGAKKGFPPLYADFICHCDCALFQGKKTIF